MNELEVKARKYKRLFEKIKFNPHHLHVNGDEFYLVYYQKRITNKTTMVLLSTNSNSTIEEYNNALESMLFLLVLSSNIINYGGQRKNINMKAFYTTRDFFSSVLDNASLSENEQQIYHSCLEALNTQIELQEKHINLMNEYMDYYKEKEEKGFGFLPEDIDYTKEVFLEMDYIQYKQLLINQDAINLFEKAEQIRKSNDSIKNSSNFETNQYIKEFARGERKLAKEINSVTYVEGLENMTKNEHKEAVWEYFYTGQKKRINSMKKDIRHPKL
ncbi:hypothetical protein [Virgibacillus ihumii]|uniref:hypothetical protein n=1 Tax=Virgibacillus ihumii TaxID=2686091 RepID=UPI00157D3308|nr:hypothetical protein [Virgibacillus ihumii]